MADARGDLVPESSGRSWKSLAVTAQADPIATAAVVAPAPRAALRGVEEHQPTGRISAGRHAPVQTSQLDERRQEIADEAAPAITFCRDHPVGVQAERRPAHERASRRRPAGTASGEVADHVPDRGKVGEVRGRRRAIRHLDAVVPQVRDGIIGVAEMVVILVARRRPREPVGARPVECVRHPEQVRKRPARAHLDWTRLSRPDATHAVTPSPAYRCYGASIVQSLLRQTL